MSRYKRKDHLYEKARQSGYRSRAAYKLIELQKRFRCLKKGMRVLDLGAWPGGWMQVAAARVGESGAVVGIDLKEAERFKESNVHYLVGDVGDSTILRKACTLVDGKFDLVLSDMSPKLSGIRVADQAGIVHCAELARAAAMQTLCPGGTLILKVFPGNEIDEFVKSTRRLFNKVIRVGLKSTRTSSNEFYLACLGMKSNDAIDETENS